MALIPRFLALRALHARDLDHEHERAVVGRCVPVLSLAASFDVGVAAACRALPFARLAPQIGHIAVSLPAELDHLVVLGDPQHFVDLKCARTYHGCRPLKISWRQNARRCRDIP